MGSSKRSDTTTTRPPPPWTQNTQKKKRKGKTWKIPKKQTLNLPVYWQLFKSIYIMLGIINNLDDLNYMRGQVYANTVPFS